MVREAAGQAPATEKAVVDALLSHIPQHFGKNSKYALEVRSHGRCRTDVAILARGRLIAVEVKLVDWKRAIFQALLNRYCVDFSYLALWQDQITKAVLNEARLWGLGVLAVTPKGVTAAQKATRAAPDSQLRARMLQQIRRNGKT